MSHKQTQEFWEALEENFLQALAEENWPLAADIIKDAIEAGVDSEYTDHLKASLKRAKKAAEEI